MADAPKVTGLRLTSTQEIAIIDKEEFDKLWMKALPSKRMSSITLDVLNVSVGGIRYVQQGHLEWKRKSDG
jgi:hypothetical protein